MPDPREILTAVATDGAGGYQARCLTCGWRGRWQESGPPALRKRRALDEARAHGRDHAEGRIPTPGPEA